eukprot:SAG22_NODE_19584_length_273_cov_1.114943_1_plen_57_part_10
MILTDSRSESSAPPERAPHGDYGERRVGKLERFRQSCAVVFSSTARKGTVLDRETKE